MKNRINLYTAELQPKLDLLSLASVLSAWLLITVLFLLCYSGFAYYHSSVASELAQQKYRRDNLNRDVNNMKESLANRQPDPHLIKLVEQQEIALHNRKLLLDELSQRENIKQQGFTQILDDLAHKNSASIWLDTIEVGESSMKLLGKVTQPQAMPQWLRRLGQSTSFSGRTFDSARVFREDDELRFELKTSRSADLPTGGYH